MTTPSPILQRSDASTLEEWDTTTSTYRMWSNGDLVIERPFTPEETAAFITSVEDATRDANHVALVAQVTAALATDAVYLQSVTAGTATADDHLAQVPLLTSQVQALIRLVVGDALLDTTDIGDTPPSAGP